MPHAIVHYDLRQYPFPELVADILNVRRLEETHYLTYVPAEQYAPGKDQATAVHKLFYEAMHRLLPLYRTFVREELARHVPGEGAMIYQAKPTFRWHAPGNVAVGAFHKDSEYQHQPEELNFWIPLTRTNKHNTIWIESEPDKGDYAPVLVDPGEVLLFHGSKLSHGNVKNESAFSRVSLDLRALRKSHYVPDWGGQSFNTNRRFTIGGYYAELPAAEVAA